MQFFFKDRIRELRGSRTQREMARLLEMPQPNYAGYETGKNMPGGEKIILICQTFGVSADWLLGLSDVAEVPHCQHHHLKVAEPPPLDYMA